METKIIIGQLGALAQETRLAVWRLLIQAGPAGMTVGAIGEALAIPPATLSFHLKALSSAGLLGTRQQGRFIHCTADFAAMHALLGYLGENCCGGVDCSPASANQTSETMKNTPSLNILVLCTGNSARSILGEALFNHYGNLAAPAVEQAPVRVRAYSAGSQPGGQVNPLALETLEKHGIPLPPARSKSWDEFTAPGAPQIDFIFTVCASAAGETCPVWPGHPATVHWGIPDPAPIEPIAARRQAFEVAYGQLERRIQAFLAMPLKTMSPDDIKAAARRIHEAAE